MEKEQFYKYHEKLHESYLSHEFELLETQVHEYLKIAEDFKDNWNYGNALHRSYIYLGLIALSKNKLKEAENYLMLSAQKTSPQIKTSGPNMLLASKFFELGEKEIFNKYLKACKKIWWWACRTKWYWECRRSIRRGEIPNSGLRLKVILYDK